MFIFNLLSSLQHRISSNGKVKLGYNFYSFEHKNLPISFWIKLPLPITSFEPSSWSHEINMRIHTTDRHTFCSFFFFFYDNRYRINRASIYILAHRRNNHTWKTRCYMLHQKVLAELELEPFVVQHFYELAFWSQWTAKLSCTFESCTHLWIPYYTMTLITYNYILCYYLDQWHVYNSMKSIRTSNKGKNYPNISQLNYNCINYCVILLYNRKFTICTNLKCWLQWPNILIGIHAWIKSGRVRLSSEGDMNESVPHRNERDYETIQEYKGFDIG